MEKETEKSNNNPLLEQKIDLQNNKEYRDLFKQLFHFSPFSMLIHDREMNIIDANEKAIEMFGYPEVELLAKKVFDLHVESELEHSAQVLDGLKEKDDLTVETSFVRKDGTVFFAKATPCNYKLERQELIYVFIQDITEQKQAENKVRESDNKFRSIFEGSNDGIILVDNNINVEEVNSAYSRITGVPKEDMIGKSAFSIAKKHINIKQLPHVLSILKKAIQKTPVKKFELLINNKIIEVSTGNFNEEQRVGIIRDITKCKTAEKKQQQIEERLKGIVKNTSSCIAVYSAVDNGKDFVFVDFNPSAEKAENISKEKVIGGKVTEVFPSVKEFGLLKVFQNVWKTGKPQHFPVSNYQDDRIHGYRENYVYKLSSGEIVTVYNDLTKQKLAEKELKKEKQFLEAVFDSISEGIVSCDANGILTRFNKAAKEFHGLPEKAIPAEEWAKLYDLFQTDGKTIMRKEDIPLYRALNEGSVQNAEMMIIPKNGEPRSLVANGQLLKDSKGDSLGAVVAMHDITERKHAVDLLRESELKFKDMSNLLPLIVYEHDINGKLTYVNKQGYEIAGYSQEDFEKGFNVLQAFPYEERDRIKVNIQKILKGEKPKNREYTLLRKDGTLFPVLIYSSLIIKNDKPAGVRGVVVDFTERKRYESELLESEEKYHLLYDNSPDILVSVSPDDGTIQLCNKMLLEKTGYTKKEVIGFPFFKFYHEDCMADVEKVFQEFVDKGEVKDKELTLKRKDGSKLEISLSVSSVIDATSKILYSVSTARDITETKKAEEVIRIQGEELEKLYTKTLNAQEDERKRISQELHDDLGQTIATVQLNLREISKKSSGSLDSNILKNFENTLDLVDHLDKRIHDISYELRPSMLDELGIYSTLSWFTDKFQKTNNIKTELKIIGSRPKLNIDISTTIFRIVQEALNNITKHAKAKKIKVFIDISSKSISLNIYDNGRGFNVEKTMLNLYKHEQMGILGIKEKVKLLNGDFKILANPQKGTSIIIKIPRVK